MMGLYTCRSLAFAEQIINKYRKFGRYNFYSSSLVFARDVMQPFAFYERVIRETSRILRTSVLLQTDRILLSRLKEQTKQIFMNRLPQETGRLPGEHAKNFSLYHNITTIFENRDRQPDLARKAERKLIRILSEDFFGRTEMINRFRDAVFPPQQERSRILENRILRRKETERTEERFENITNRLTVQEKILKELRETRRITDLNAAPPPVSVDGIVKEVIKKMNRELHVEKLRRGW